MRSTKLSTFFSIVQHTVYAEEIMKNSEIDSIGLRVNRQTIN